MVRARSAALLVSHEADYREIISWYRDLLDRTVPPTGLEWEPIKIGPTWQWDGGWVLPEASLGWHMLAWCGVWLRGRGDKPWKFTAEQARFLLWFYALDPDGAFQFHSAVLQRLKGWGKDPLAACIAVAAMFADIQFDHWDGDWPVGRDEPDAWVQLVAVSQDQTKNTMKLMPGLISVEARRRYGIQIGKTSVWGLGDTRQIEAVTASPLALEGGRPKLIVPNEHQNWNGSNGGHDMWGVIEGNAAKASSEAPARILCIGNAYRPGEDSVAQRIREGWEATQGDPDAAEREDRPKFLEFGLMYDSLEAPPEAPLTAAAAPAVVESVRGDADWLDTKRIIKSIVNPANPPSESRRKWFNQITAAEDAFTTPQKWTPNERHEMSIEAGEDVVLFLDCSKSDDATGLVVCRLSDGLVDVVGMWQRPPGTRGKDWLAPREKVDAAVDAAFRRYRVLAFFGDPSHVLDDETYERYWDGLFDQWHRRYGRRLKLWAKPGKSGHAVMFDMTDFQNQRKFTAAVGQAEADIDNADFLTTGDARLRTHMLNARRYPSRAGLSIAKDGRESRHKVDLAVCAIGARMVRRMYLNETETKRGRGRVW